ncbi:MAG: glutathione S-transferase family protein [Thalassotalea sp.]
MKLLGSTTSPYVRRIRLYLAGHEVEFVNLDIFSEQDRSLLTQNNPAQKIPALIDNEHCIYDSRVIYRHLNKKFNDNELTWQQENLLTLIDAANDSMVSMLLLSRSNIDTKQDNLFFNLQRERVGQILLSLDKEVAKGSFKQWNYLSICLFCLLDWLSFRDLFHWQEHRALLNFYQDALQIEGVVETDPREL